MLQDLTDRPTRQALFEKSWTRATKGDANDTRATIVQMAKLRAEKSKLLGYPNYAAYVLEDQMAKTPEAVNGFMAKLVAPARAKAAVESADIQAVIDAEKGGFKLQPWDWDLYAEKVRKARYDLRVAGVTDDERVVMVGYSKGAIDILQLLVDFPDLAQRVAAVVSVAGPIYGSPLAETADGWYRHLFKDSFAGLCDPGDGGVISSLLPEVRRDWIESHRLPEHVRFYSIAAFPTRKHLARGLEISWQMLASTDPRNDGQVLIGDALIPGSTLLGYANADHWDIAIAVERQMPVFSGRPSNRQFPRDALFEAMLRYVGETLPTADGVNDDQATGR